FPTGRYKITSPIVLTAIKGGHIFGDGIENSVFIYSGAYKGTSGVFTPRAPNQLDSDLTPIWLVNGLAFAMVEGLGFRMSDSHSACIYGWTEHSSSPVLWKNCGFGGATWGVFAGGSGAAASPNNNSEWFFDGCYFANCGHAGVRIKGQNTLNFNFRDCSVAACGNNP